MSSTQQTLTRPVIHYHVNDLVELSNTLEGKTKLYIVDKRRHPQAFKETTMKVVADCTFEELVQLLDKTDYLIYNANRHEYWVKLVGHRHKSIIFIDALKSMPTTYIADEIERGMEKNYAHHLLYAWKDSGLLERVFPELYDCVSVDGGNYHNGTVFEHLMDSLMWAKDYPIDLQWAVLLHDVGKPPTFTTKQQGGKVKVSFHQHEVVGASIAYNICKRFNFTKKRTRYIVTLVRYHMFRFYEDSSDKTIKKWLFQVGRDTWRDLFRLRIADRKGNRANKNKPVITHEMRELEKRIESLISEGKCIFKEDLNISEKEIRSLLKNNSAQLKEVYTNLIGLVNSDESRNKEEWLRSYVKRIYKSKSNKSTNGNNLSQVQ